MNSIKKIKNLKGQVVLLRTDYNVPIVNGKVSDTFRIDASMVTIDYLIKKGARIVILAHIGDDGKQSLAPVASYLNKYIKTIFVPSSDMNAIVPLVSKMQNGEVMLLENIRRFEGEKNNDITLAKAFASLGNFYVNDAFSVSHRAHMSIVGISKYLPSFAGLQLEQEVQNLSMALKPAHPFLFILGGVKFETKLPLIKKYIKMADNLFIGGALANEIFEEDGMEVGTSVVDKKDFHLQKLAKNKKVILPVDVVTESKEKGIIKNRTISVSEVNKKEKMMDIGPKTVENLEKIIMNSKFVLWNGPLGYYEGGYDKATKNLLKILAKAKINRKVKVIIGGGDTVTLVDKMKLQNAFTFVSTGGGASLEFLTKGTLFGIKVLK